MKFHDQVRQILTVLLPPNACVMERPPSPREPASIEFEVSWPLNCDLRRPFKMSRTIHLRIGHEVVEEFRMMTTPVQLRAYQAISHFLVTRLGAFRPDHDFPKHLCPPVEHWEIDCSVIFDSAREIAPARLPHAARGSGSTSARLH
jgi:hypothetical protein